MKLKLPFSEDGLINVVIITVMVIFSTLGVFGVNLLIFKGLYLAGAVLISVSVIFNILFLYVAGWLEIEWK